MEPTQVDGIRKLSKEEIKRSRDIVLDTIGEVEPKPLPSANDYLINSGNISKKMDGLSEAKKVLASNIAFEKKTEKVLTIIDGPEKIVPEPAKPKSLSTPQAPIQPKKEIPRVKRPNIFSRLMESYKKRAEEKKKIKEKQAESKRQEKEKTEILKKQAQEKEKQDKIKKEQEANKSALEKQKNSEAEQPKSKKQTKDNKTFKEKNGQIIDLGKPEDSSHGEIKEMISIAGYDLIKKEGVDFMADLKSEKIKKEKPFFHKKDKEKINILKAEEKRRQEEEREKKRAEKKQQKELRKEKIKEFAKSLNRRIVLISKRSIYVTTITFVSCISIYFLMLISIVQFDIDNAITRRIAGYIPIPAYVSTDGIMEYFKYKDMKAELLAKSGDYGNIENDIKMAVVKRLVLENLANKYRLLFNVEKDFIRQITTQLAFDMDVNIVPINRIKKIKQLIDKQGDFVRVATKYGDELGQITTDYNNSQNLYYFDEVKNLELGQISETVLTPQGYYIFKCFDKDSASIALSYVFIKSNTLDDYVNEEVKGYKLISFVD
jgi:hypothetical protein